MGKNNRFPFTKTRLEALHVPQNKRVYYYDARTEGLAICVTPAGTKTFYLYKWATGRPVRIPLGRFPTMAVEQAQKAAKPLVAEISQGRDPQVARQAARHEQTVKGLWEYWLEHARQRKRTWAEDERQYNVFLKPWAGRKLSAVKRGDVASLHARVGRENGLYAANRLLALVRAMFNKATDIGFAGPNPTTGIKKFKETKRDRFLHEDELKKFFDALAQESNPLFRDFFIVALLTGARRANVQAMRWQDINFRAGVWRIPETKSGLPVVVPLMPVVVKILQNRLDDNGNSNWVFQSYGKTGHLTEPKTAWKRIITSAGLSDVRPHDLRRTLASYMAMGGVSLPIIGKMLGHTQASTTMIYARLQTSSVKDAVEQATATILEAGGVKLLTEEK